MGLKLYVMPIMIHGGVFTKGSYFTTFTCIIKFGRQNLRSIPPPSSLGQLGEAGATCVCVRGNILSARA